jgi:chromosomal replication initiation ATPase DnaA
VPVSLFPAVSQYKDKDIISASRAQGTAPFGASDARQLCADGLIQARTRNVEASVALVFGVRHESLRASTRGKADVARARQVAMYLCHTTLGFSLTTVGDLFDRDRTTVSHACRVVEDLRDVSDFDARLSYLEHTVLAGCIVAPQPISTPAWERAHD